MKDGEKTRMVVPEDLDLQQAQTIVERGFWRKVKRLLGKLGFLTDAVALYYVMLDKNTPAWVKAVIVSALAYFVIPTDAIPDILGPLAGYIDDASVIAGALKLIGKYVTDEHKERAKKALGIE